LFSLFIFYYYFFNFFFYLIGNVGSGIGFTERDPVVLIRCPFSSLPSTAFSVIQEQIRLSGNSAISDKQTKQEENCIFFYGIFGATLRKQILKVGLLRRLKESCFLQAYIRALA
jgi:hypothetical protein